MSGNWLRDCGEAQREPPEGSGERPGGAGGLGQRGMTREITVSARRRDILGLLAAAMLVLPVPEGSNAADAAGGTGGYVVLTDLSESDPYFAAARRLQQHRSARLIR